MPHPDELARAVRALDPTIPDVLETIASDMRHDCLQVVYPAELERIAAEIRATLLPRAEVPEVQGDVSDE